MSRPYAAPALCVTVGRDSVTRTGNTTALPVKRFGNSNLTTGVGSSLVPLQRPTERPSRRSDKLSNARASNDCQYHQLHYLARPFKPVLTASSGQRGPCPHNNSPTSPPNSHSFLDLVPCTQTWSTYSLGKGRRDDVTCAGAGKNATAVFLIIQAIRCDRGQFREPSPLGRQALAHDHALDIEPTISQHVVRAEVTKSRRVVMATDAYLPPPYRSRSPLFMLCDAAAHCNCVAAVATNCRRTCLGTCRLRVAATSRSVLRRRTRLYSDIYVSQNRFRVLARETELPATSV
ncbi:unnamed protein product [Plutella xylostella]|uniref:(diamondback moth) hypothetical protein n=1 Tax=Plutella xylostella TaxID=51655 RepID=A0A8S4FP33_PLUXY|nr:unnamed protein product [Plutella xylostella]